jgi:hypothetical protein
LAHVLTPDLSGSNAGEDFADTFAGALLYPKACAESAYREAVRHTKSDSAIKVLMGQADAHMISLNTVYQQVRHYAASSDLIPLPIQETAIHAVRNSRRGALVSQALFDPMPPSPQRYIAACENTFQTDFFHALKRMIVANGTGAAYIQQVLDTSLQDAVAFHEALRH